MIAKNVVTNQPIAGDEVGKDLDEIRDWIGFGPAEIGSALGLTAEQIRRWARGQARPSNFVYLRLLLLKRFAHQTWVAMPFNPVQQRHDWWLAPIDGYGSPLAAFKTDARSLLQQLIVNHALRYGRQQLADAA